jgi:hypothetical protein
MNLSIPLSDFPGAVHPFISLFQEGLPVKITRFLMGEKKGESGMEGRGGRYRAENKNRLIR